MVKIFFAQMRQKMKDLSLDIVIPVYFLNLVLEMAHFFPNLRDINIWDEATYVQTGYRLLTQGQWPNLASSPLSSVMYALTALPVIKSPNFFLLSDAIARIFLFTLIFFSAYLIARECRPYANHWVMLGILFVVPVATTMYLYPSDALFAGFSGLAFWQMIAFYNHRQRRHLGWASAFMGMGMLARAEGLLLIGIMLIVTLIIVLPDRSWYRDVIALLIPFLILVGGYVLVYGMATGDFGTGLPERTFNNFESGHESIYSQTGIFSPTISARLEANEVFGTAEENNYSVFRAISRNPEVYSSRLRLTVPSFVKLAVKAYGNKFILIFIWLSLRGLIALIHKKHMPLALMGVLWFLPLGVGFLNTFFREGYFMMPYFVVFAFSSIGLSVIIENIDKTSEKLGLVLASLSLTLVSLLARNPSMLFRNVLFIFGLAFIYVLYQRLENKNRWRNQAFWCLLALVLVIRGGYQSPELPDYGSSDLEQSVYFLQKNLPASSHVLAGAPASIWAARMTYFGINSFDIPDFGDEDAFLKWVQVQKIKAVYVDRHFPEVFQFFINSLSGEGLHEVYATPERDIVIYFVNEDGLQ